MKQFTPTRKASKHESGYAIVIVMFFLALLVLGMAAAAPTVVSDIQREREKDMIWKGEQYARGVKLYYMRVRRFPTSMDDLTQNRAGIRFMRQAYKDPMNATDGSWRLIYVGPNGQLIGSVKNRAFSINGQPTVATGLVGSQSQSSFGGGFGSSSFGTGNSQNGNTNAGGTASGTGTDSSSSSSSGQPQTLGQPLGTMDASSVIGGNIIGVGSKIDKKSFIWYDKSKNYKEFEFIWDPSKDVRIGGATRGIGTPVNGTTTSPGVPVQNQSPNGTPDPTANPPLQAPPPSSN